MLRHGGRGMCGLVRYSGIKSPADHSGQVGLRHWRNCRDKTKITVANAIELPTRVCGAWKTNALMCRTGKVGRSAMKMRGIRDSPVTGRSCDRVASITESAHK